MTKISILLLSLFVFFGSSLRAQTIEQTLEKLDNYNVAHPQEKLYLQLDKYAYTAGETIWFKAYTTVGIYNFFSNLSGIAYVELIDASMQKVDSLIIPLGMGIGIGDITLSDTITEGSYRLRAYTNWMRNADNKYFYDRTIQISNGRTDNVLTTTVFEEGPKNNTYTIALQAISGEPLAKTNVRYEVIHQGKSVERKRATTDEKGNLVIALAKKYKEAQVRLNFVNHEKQGVNKLIKIINAAHASAIQILPEGGKLLAGFINTVAVKALNEQGLGVKSQVIFTNGKDTLGNLLTNELGMGAFSLYLNPGDSLYAFAAYDNAAYVPVEVPPIYNTGYGLQINNQQESRLFAQVNISEDLVNGEELYFLAHHLGKVLFVSKQKATKTELSFSMPKKELPSGVITITILGSKFEPIVERPIFNYNANTLLALDVAFDKQTYGLREKVNVSLNVLGNDTLKIAALSASVLNRSKITDNPNTAANILSTLLLSEDLNGYIEKPGFYFEGDRVKTLDMDYLMLTQGWRNVDWKALDLDLKMKFPAEKSLSISGFTKKLGRTKPEGGAKVQMISTKNYMDFIDTTANEEGYFNFSNLLFADSIKFLITARDEKGKNNIDIVYSKPLLAGVGVNKNWGDERWDVNSLYQAEINASKRYFTELERAGLKEKAIAIEEVVVRARQEPKVAKNSSNLNGAGRADQIVTAEDLSTCATLEMCLAGRLVGVTWQMGVPYNTRGNQPMQVVLDGMFIEPDQISMVNVADVESIEVLRNANYTSVYGSNGGNGLIIITSKRGDSALRSFVPKGIITIQPMGVRMNTEYYKPDYEVSNAVKYNQDLRTTIHWEPLLVTNQAGASSFSFFTADEKGTYIVVIEGLDLFGRICRSVHEIEIK